MSKPDIDLFMLNRVEARIARADVSDIGHIAIDRELARDLVRLAKWLADVVVNEDGTVNEEDSACKPDIQW